MPVVAVLAGLLFATTEVTAAGTDLRAGRRLALADLIGQRQRDIALLNETAARVRAEVESATAQEAAGNQDVLAQRQASAALAAASGLNPITGSGLRVSLNDSSRHVGDPLPPGVPAPTPDDLVVHQQDVQAVVNALWAGGATGMTIMGQRVISTSAVRCVGNTLLLHGVVYSPPFVVAATGNPADLRTALDAAPGVQLFRQYVDTYSLGYSVNQLNSLTLPGYTGTLELEHAKALGP